MFILSLEIYHDTLLCTEPFRQHYLPGYLCRVGLAIWKNRDRIGSLWLSGDDRKERFAPSPSAGVRRKLFVAKQILVVDDKNELLHLMRRVLEDEQYQVSILQEGREAFTRVKITLPDLLILDLRLGDISGQDVLKLLKADPLTADIPVIVYTAAVLEAEEVTRLISSQPGRYAGVHVVQKPFELESLLTLVQQVLNEPVV